VNSPFPVRTFKDRFALEIDLREDPLPRSCCLRAWFRYLLFISYTPSQSGSGAVSMNSGALQEDLRRPSSGKDARVHQSGRRVAPVLRDMPAGAQRVISASYFSPAASMSINL
jgi:hypothetical protein